MKTWFLYHFINKWLPTILYHFNKNPNTQKYRLYFEMTDVFFSTANVQNLFNYFIIHADWTYHQISDIRRKLVGREIGDHSDVVGAPPVDTAPTTSSFPT